MSDGYPVVQKKILLVFMLSNILNELEVVHLNITPTIRGYLGRIPIRSTRLDLQLSSWQLCFLLVSVVSLR